MWGEYYTDQKSKKFMWEDYYIDQMLNVYLEQNFTVFIDNLYDCNHISEIHCPYQK